MVTLGLYDAMPTHHTTGKRTEEYPEGIPTSYKWEQYPEGGGYPWGSKEMFTKAAKKWNWETYGTHYPTRDAKKAGLTKKKLAAQYKASQKEKRN